MGHVDGGNLNRKRYNAFPVAKLTDDLVLVNPVHVELSQHADPHK